MRTQEFILEGIKFVFHYHDENDMQQLNEARSKGIPLVGNYSIRKDPPHNPTGEYHIHGYEGQNQIFSMNKSGSAHDGFHGAVIPKRAYDALVKKFPDWNWPENRIIESLNYVGFFEITERSHLRPVFVKKYKDLHLNEGGEYPAFFHGYAECPFLTGGGGGWKNYTKAIIEEMNGNLKTVPVESLRFIDTSDNS